MDWRHNLERVKRIRWYSFEWRIKKLFNKTKEKFTFPKKDYLNAGERYDPNIAEFYDACHVKRYEFAMTMLKSSDKVLDIACGTGWGSNMISDSCQQIIGADISRDAIKIANKKYKRKNISFVRSDFFEFNKKADVVISFETLEHLKADSFDTIIKKLYSLGDKTIIGSVPYEEVPGINPHHISFHLNESNFSFLLDKGDLNFFYQDSKGSIHKSKDSIKPQNLLFVFSYNN